MLVIFPNLLPEKSSQLRETLVKNQTLAECAALYRFQDRAKLPPEFNSGGNYRERTHTKVMANIFEALRHQYERIEGTILGKSLNLL